MSITTSIVIPTRDRPRYLETALSSIVPQARALDAEVLVIDDGGESQLTREVTSKGGARYEPHAQPLGLNVARNTGIERSRGELVVFVDDDVQAQPGWLLSLVQAAQAHPRTLLFAGRIIAKLEGDPPRSCGRELPPITTLDLGPSDHETDSFAWGANMAIRRSAFTLVGPFDPALSGGGDEQEWQERLRATGAPPTLYVAGAELLHRREPRDARLRALARAAYARGAQSRDFDALRGAAPSTGREIVTLLGCAGHVVRYRCPNGLTMVAHSGGRLWRALRERGSPAARTAARARAAARPAATARAAATAPARTDPADDFLSGESGTVGGLDGVRREIADRVDDALDLVSGRRARLGRASAGLPSRRVLAIGVTRERHRALVESIVAELRGSRHAVQIATSGPGHLGKFENLNALLAEHPADGFDWLVVFDDDIELPKGFLDGFLFLAERFGLDLAQPAHRRASHAAWQVTRRQSRRSVARETQFVEVGPLTAFASSTFDTLLPFPPLKMGWGLDAHWAAIARQRGWRCGVIDAVAIKHRVAPAAESYSRAQTIAEARAFLSQRPYLPAREAQRTLAVHRRW
jgi:GT2 family glycosyltransferase